MKIWLRTDETEAEISVRGAYNPDVLRDLCNRVAELVITEVAAQYVLLAEEEPEPQ